nr:MAG TPA: hypothetical protein [Caudoviricetes sp.]
MPEADFGSKFFQDFSVHRSAKYNGEKFQI